MTLMSKTPLISWTKLPKSYPQPMPCYLPWMWKVPTQTSTIQQVKQAFSNVDKPDRPDKDILELLLIYLKNNDFQFGILPSDTWHCNGENVPPNYANIFMAEWEKQALRKYTKLPLIYLGGSQNCRDGVACVLQ